MAAPGTRINDTRIAQWIVGRADRYNKKVVIPGALMLGLDMANSGVGPFPVQAILDKMRTFTNKPKIASVDKDAVTISTERKPAGTFPAFGTTSARELERLTFEAAWSIIPTEHGDNAVGAQEMFNALAEQAVAGLLYAVENALIPIIEANRTQVNTTSWPFAFNTTTDAIEATTPVGGDFEKEAKVVEKALTSAENWLEGQGIGKPVALLCSTSVKTSVKEAGYFGAANDRDLTGILGGAAPYYSSAIATGSGTPATIAEMYAFAQNSYGVYTWVSPEAQQGITHGNRALSMQFVPGLGFSVEFYREGNFVDQSAREGGSKLTSTETYRMMFDIVVATAVVTDPTTQPLPIVKATVTAAPVA